MLGENVTRICSDFVSLGTFSRCTALSEIVWNDKIEYIGESAFNGCTALRFLTLPDSVKTVDSTAFRDCTGLKEINFGAKLETNRGICILRLQGLKGDCPARQP